MKNVEQWNGIMIIRGDKLEMSNFRVQQGRSSGEETRILQVVCYHLLTERGNERGAEKDLFAESAAVAKI